VFYDPHCKGSNYVDTHIKYLAFNSFYSHNSVSDNNLPKDEFIALKNLSKSNDVVITKPDKGNGIVLLNKQDYVNKMMDIISETNKFNLVQRDIFSVMLQCEGKINRLLSKLLTNDVITQDTYRNLYAKGSTPGIMYGLPKVHKDGIPLRPILSAIGTCSYQLAKFLVPILTPLTTNIFTVKDSFTFAKEITTISFDKCCMVSFDIVSLFTNIPLKETIDICMNNLFQTVETVQGFSKENLRKMLELSVQDCHFIFNNQLFIQRDGVAMGSPLGPTLANAFLCYYEHIWLSNCPIPFKPLYYRRFVDDTFLIFKAQEHVQEFLSYLNSQHPNMKFTVEYEKDGKLPFLDMYIHHSGNSFDISMYRKPTFTGLCSKFSSFIPLTYKRNLVNTLTTRAYYICSNWTYINQELSFIRNLLYNNGFPKHFTDTYIGKTLNNILSNKHSNITVPKKVLYFPVTYTGPPSLQLKQKVSKLVSEFYPQIKLRVIFRTKNIIQNLFKFKDTVPSELKSNIVYKYTCDSCKASYIGKTTKHLKTRISQHLGISDRTGTQMTKPPFSAIRNHADDTDHPIHRKDFSVLASTPYHQQLLIMESILTYIHKPSLSNNETSTPLLCF